MDETTATLHARDLAATRQEGRPASGTPRLGRHQLESELVCQHLGLAGALASRFYARGVERDDLRQVAMLALVEAARRFDPERGASFAGYASVCILGELKRYFRNRTWVIRPPRGIQELYLQVKQTRKAMTQELGTSPTVQQVADRLGVGEEQVLEALEAGANYWPASLDAATGEGGALDPVNDEDFADALVNRAALQAFLLTLEQRERTIVTGYFFEGRTQARIAGEMDLTQMQVSRLLARSIAKLRLWLREE